MYYSNHTSYQFIFLLVFESVSGIKSLKRCWFFPSATFIFIIFNYFKILVEIITTGKIEVIFKFDLKIFAAGNEENGTNSFRKRTDRNSCALLRHSSRPYAVCFLKRHSVKFNLEIALFA